MSKTTTFKLNITPLPWRYVFLYAFIGGVAGSFELCAFLAIMHVLAESTFIKEVE